MASASIHHNVYVTWQMHSETDLNSSDDVQKTLAPIAFLPRLNLTGSCTSKHSWLLSTHIISAPFIYSVLLELINHKVNPKGPNLS